MILRVLILCFFLAGGAVAQTCSSSSRCENGCCNTNGFCGFGPDYCGDKCISDCDRKSECNPGFDSKWAKKEKCPLNVCCSKHGYCGTTQDFCGNKTVSHKTCSKNNGNQRIIGYYEGWVSNRPCNVFWPEQIPVGLYTHINFAFATIDPKTFKVGPSARDDVSLYKRIMLLKQKDPDLKVFIAIGGWTFNDPGPTATTFSDLAASIPRQKSFIESLLSFMSTYGFDGVDLDWEYPAADDRSGREVDFDNFPKFMARLKSSLDSASKAISITLPASFWYLQHFDLKALAKSVSWFNVMSYDLHGTWDKGNKWTGNFLNAHTNLTEIKDALDLIWRNDIDPGQVVMGLGFYGRAFSATSQSCLEPGCTFESGGERGKCSREVGILLNSEIDDLVKQNKVKPKHYKKEAVKVATWGNQWVAYDDEETFAQKSEFAQTYCLGGLMVWAISHDTKDTKYNKALAKVANRKITSLPMTDGSDEPYKFVDFPNPQCKWTNCGEGCPSGWVHMTREDSGKRGKEYMLDESACAGSGVHAFCCPTNDKLPTCGWYTHHNGNCDQKCPDGTVEVGSNNMYCKKNYQAACCTTGSKSMKLYMKCEWGQYPMCNSQAGCPGSDSSKNTLLAVSSGGTGGGSCNMWKLGAPGSGIFEVQQRKFCCDTSEKKGTWSDCEWYNNYGLGPSGAPEKFCRSGCPNDRVRVAMDQWSTDCYVGGGGGGKARCCIPSYSDTVEVENPKLDQYRSDMKRYLDNPTCKNPGPIFDSRAVGMINTDRFMRNRIRNGELTVRSEADGVNSANGLLLLLVTKSATTGMLEALEKIWDDSVGDKYPNLKISGLRSFITRLPNYGSEGPIQIVHSIICSPHYWSDRAGKKKLVCIDGICTKDSCDGVEGRSLLDKRILSARDYSHTLNDGHGGQITITTTLPRYQGIYDLATTDPMNDEAVDFADRDDCENTRVAHFSLPSAERFEMEHTFDGNLIGRFMQDAAAGRLRSGSTARTGPVAISFFRTARTMPLLPGAPTLPGGADSLVRLFDRVMASVGNEWSTANFVIAHKDINYVKTFLMQGQDPIARTRLPALCSNYDDPGYVLTRVRASIGLIHYLNHQGTPNT
ncbi:glycoside hydrolase [Lindgomyces ingoldianus]|uniref:Glycoside hydrolase n=1 Tax=Lindgomyces ingoldianus TaxID=673940 RepID=A0ACB6QGN8_9PLEO|nr:glycoside hydrolase [Lindgomyces ingoldianus]KAF2466138.1 glycoside hydrolase [Lindgomyces ingoldianus]